MKKVIKYLIGILLLFPILVFADAGAPEYAPYDAYVSDKKGANLYEMKYENGEDKLVSTKYFLEYNTDIKIYEEMEISKGVVYGEISYDDKSLYLSLDKISPRKDVYTLDDLKKELGDSYEEATYGVGRIITADDKTVIYNGPSIKYPVKNENIAKDTIFDVKADLYRWIYVENNDYSGWIKGDSNYADGNEGTLWLLEDSQAYAEPLNAKSAPLEITIPKGEKFNDTFEYYIEEGDKYYYSERIEYNGETYYLKRSSNGHAYSTEGKRLVVKELNATSEITGGESFTIPVHSVIELSYETGDYYYVKYDNKEGWIKPIDLADYMGASLMVAKEINYYKTVGGNLVGTIPVNTEFKTYYVYYQNIGDNEQEWYYIKYKDGNYWIKDNNVCQEVDEGHGEYDLEKEKVIYDSPSGKETGKKVPVGTTINAKYYYYDNASEDAEESWFYVDTKSYKGWIKEDDDEDMGDLISAIEESQQEGNGSIFDKPVTIEHQEIIINKKVAKKEYIIIGALSAVILALMTYVVILLVNKKKKEKVEPVKEEQPQEEKKDA